MKPRYVIKATDLGKTYRRAAEGRAPTDRKGAEGSWLGKLLPKPRPQEEFVALQGVTFELEPGSRIAVLGRNGAGKSTLLKLIARVTRPSHGELRIRGRVGSLLEVGTGFHPDLSGRENIELSGAILGIPSERLAEKLDPIIEFAEIQGYVDTPVKHYSSGMVMRLAFAVASQVDAEIMLVDESLAVGDANFQRKCMGRIHALQDSGATLLFVSHNEESLRELCTRGLVLDRGALVHDLPIDDAIAAYREILRGTPSDAADGLRTQG